ncbi:hypothetical protein pdam_00007576, partial [Pocillopora damicornis]
NFSPYFSLYVSSCITCFFKRKLRACTGRRAFLNFSWPLISLNLALYNIRSLKDKEQLEANIAHKLHHLLQPKNISRYNFRNQHNFMLPIMHTNLYTNANILSMSNR